MYFMTVFAKGFSMMEGDGPHVIGYRAEPFTTADLTEKESGKGYFEYAVQEFYPPGLHAKGTIIGWWRFEEGQWKVTETPEWAKCNYNWAY